MTKEQELEKIKASMVVFDIHGMYKKLILQALENWDWYNECDGCTFVNENWNGDYFPPCLVHDYLRHIKFPALTTDLIFKDLIYKYTRSKIKSFLFFVGVRLSWLIFKR